MKARPKEPLAEDAGTRPAMHGITLEPRVPVAEGIDLSLLEDSLSKTPWERMQANDDALRFAESLRAAMEKRNAESQRTDAQAH